jgi:hypothetical protein
MSQGGEAIVRKPLRAHERSSRTHDHWLSLRFPRFAAANARLIGKLPPGSRLRRAGPPRAVRLAESRG